MGLAHRKLANRLLPWKIRMSLGMKLRDEHSDTFMQRFGAGALPQQGGAKAVPIVG